MSSLFSLKPEDEAGRLLALHRYALLDSEPEDEFDDVAQLVKSVFQVDYAAVHLIDDERQWARGAQGLAPANCSRTDAVCNHTIRTGAPLIVHDARLDPRFAGNPLVSGADGLRSYLGAPLTTPDGYNIGALCMFCTTPRDFTDEEAQMLAGFARIVMAQLELRLSARLDSLTGVPGRRSFTERLDKVVDGGGGAALLLIDLDHFKSINDTFGHPAGDAVLRQAALAMGKTIRRDDMLARIGGEEFGIILSGVSAKGAMAMAERLRSRVAELAIAELNDRRVTASIGIAMRHEGEKRSEWLKRADVALYSAKQAGRDRVIALAA